MNQILVALCPNCNTDTSKHNKILYDGIFLICHSCGYGWYYNIQIVTPENTHEYNSKSAPLSTITPKEIKGYPKKTHPAPISKRNIKNKTNREPSSHTLKNHNYPTNEDSIKNLNRNITKDKSISSESSPNKPDLNKKTKSYKYSNTSYDNNIYYNQSTSTNNVAEKINIPLDINKPQLKKSSSIKKTSPDVSFEVTTTPRGTPLPRENITPPTSLANKTPERLLHKETVSNKKPLDKQITINTNKNPTTNSNDVIINLSNLPTNNTINKKDSKEAIKPTNNALNQNNSSAKDESFVTTVPQKEASTSTNVSKYNNILPNINNDKTSVESIISKPSAKKIEDNYLPTTTHTHSIDPNSIQKIPENSNTLASSRTVPPLNTSTQERSIREDLNKSDDIKEGNLNIQPSVNSLKNSTLANLESSNLKLALNNFNMSLSTKESLGLNPSSLLKVEEQTQYNIKEYTQPKSNNIKTHIDFKEYKNKLKKSGSTLLKGIITIFTRADLLLKTLAYIFILGGIISFLWYSSNLKQKKVKETSIHNPSYNNNINNTQSKKVKFADNVDITGINTNNIYSNNESYNNENIMVTPEPTEDKINAFQKNNHIDANTYPSKKSNLNTNKKVATPTFFESLKYSIKDSWLSIKQHQQNTFNDIKLYQKTSKLSGEYNEQLISTTTLYNKNSSNSYLVKSLEIVFLENTGKVLGTRTILANQIINRNSGVDLSLKINNPPVGAKNIYIFIKDKKKI